MLGKRDIEGQDPGLMGNYKTDKSMRRQTYLWILYTLLNIALGQHIGPPMLNKKGV